MPKYTIINCEYSAWAKADLVEIVMKDTCTKEDLPTNVAPGSVAYKMAAELPALGFSADGEWEEL